jgi:hypothetical protein
MSNIRFVKSQFINVDRVIARHAQEEGCKENK